MKIIFIWGLPGAGKSTVGKHVAERLNFSFCEMDDYLPEDFKLKMKSGNLITDSDRDNFFNTFKLIVEERGAVENIVVSGYVAKKKHRDILRSVQGLEFFGLHVDEDVLRSRLRSRGGHFFNESTLDKVLNNYEPLQNAYKIDANKDIDNVVNQVCEKVQIAYSKLK